MATFTVVIRYEVPSQNTRDETHWRKRSSQNASLRDLVFYSSHGQPRATGKRWVTITSFRRKLITDDANLRGGAKALVDAIVRARLLVDDNDRMVAITYRQHVLSRMPDVLVAQWGRKSITVIEFSDHEPAPRVVIDEAEARTLGVVP